jgi:hypothetical protein
MRNLSVALAYANGGLAVFPCRPADKRPLIKWRDGSTVDPAEVNRLWRRWPDALVGLNLGKCGLVVFDADRHPGGADGVAGFVELAHQHGADLAGIPIVRTPSRGLHFYFQQPPGEPLGNREGDLPDGINVRGAGGLTIAAGSARPDGRCYEHLEDRPSILGAFEIPVVPAWLVEIVRASPRVHGGHVVVDRGTYTLSTTRRQSAWATAALERSTSALANTPNGRRNVTLNAVAFRLGRIVGRGWLARGEVEARLRAAADGCGLTKDDGAYAVIKTIASGLNAGMRAPVPDLADLVEQREGM